MDNMPVKLLGEIEPGSKFIVVLHKPDLATNGMFLYQKLSYPTECEVDGGIRRVVDSVRCADGALCAFGPGREVIPITG